MHLAPLIRDLAVILSIAAVVTLLFRLLKQPVVLGYIVAGIVVGPYTPPIFSVVDGTSVQIWAEIGVIFLMFALGLEFSFTRLRRVGTSAIVTGSTQIAVMVILGYIYGAIRGWDSINSIFLGCMIAISSTTIIIKSLEELGLKSKRFAELVIGILIVEDLAAIVMLVALGNLGIMASVSGINLLKTTFTLAFVVGAWLIIGMFVVPRIMNMVRRKGTNELLIVTSLGLCLSLVTLSASLGYSVALGAFIMGSILAETKDASTIEHLVAPLKDIFGAVFFVSVGMMLDPSVVLREWPTILAISAIVVGGKFCAVLIGALTTGQNLRTATQSALSMAQIGELSFVIASLGLNLKVIDNHLYPIIVSVSVLTTFLTPYLLKSSDQVVSQLDKRLPETIKVFLTRYTAWVQHHRSNQFMNRDSAIMLLRWFACAVVVIILFLTSSRWLLPWLNNYFTDRESNSEVLVAWIVTFCLASPFIWGMLTAFRPLTKDSHGSTTKKLPPLWAQLVTIGNDLVIIILLGALSTEFMTFWISLTATASIAVTILLLFRKRIESSFQWFENTFIAGLDSSSLEQSSQIEDDESHSHLLPWNGYLSSIDIDADSILTGKTLLELRLRERFAINIMVVQRGKQHFVAPSASLQIFPGDKILCVGSDEDMERFKQELHTNAVQTIAAPHALSTYALWSMEVASSSQLKNQSIRDAHIQERYMCMIVGLQRQSTRIHSPSSSTLIQPGDLLWVVGSTSQLQILKSICDGILINLIKN